MAEGTAAYKPVQAGWEDFPTRGRGGKGNSLSIKKLT
jgi:hypothetical protein